MEQLILFIIIALIGAFLKNRGENQEDTPKIPNEKPDRPEAPNTRKRFEDYAKEIYKDLQPQEQTRPFRDQKIEAKPKHSEQRPQQVVRVQPAVEQAPTGRFSTVKQKKVERETNVYPKDQQELLRSIVVSEIMGPPKSKRR